jgi:hypothetical protein
MVYPGLWVNQLWNWFTLFSAMKGVEVEVDATDCMKKKSPTLEMHSIISAIYMLRPNVYCVSKKSLDKKKEVLQK